MKEYLFGKYAENDIDVYNIICYTSESFNFMFTCGFYLSVCLCVSS